MLRHNQCFECVYFTLYSMPGGRAADYCARDGERVNGDSSCEFYLSESRVQTRYANNCAKLEYFQVFEGWKTDKIANLQEAIKVDRFTLDASKRLTAELDRELQ